MTKDELIARLKGYAWTDTGRAELDAARNIGDSK